MKHKMSAIILTGLLSLVFVLPVSADAPAEGTVFEGVGVPGVDLGFTRAQVTVAYGGPGACQSATAGDRAHCTFRVTGGGWARVSYQGADGGNASNSPDDVVRSIRWYDGVDWITTAGITTAIVNINPEAVLVAYPNAEVTYHSFTGEIFRVRDAQLGIQIDRSFDFYRGVVHASMLIFAPQP